MMKMTPATSAMAVKIGVTIMSNLIRILIKGQAKTIEEVTILLWRELVGIILGNHSPLK
jgi:hypothetical protein